MKNFIRGGFVVQKKHIKLMLILVTLSILAFSLMACSQLSEVGERAGSTSANSKNDIDNEGDDKTKPTGSSILSAGKYTGIIIGEDKTALLISTEVYYEQNKPFINFLGFVEDGQLVGCDNMEHVSIDNNIPIKQNGDLLEFTLNITIQAELFEEMAKNSGFSKASSQNNESVNLQWIFSGKGSEGEMKGDVTFIIPEEKDSYGKWHMSMTSDWDGLLNMYGAHVD